MGNHQGESTTAEFATSDVITAINAFVADSANDTKFRDLSYLGIVKAMATQATGTNMHLDVATFASLQGYF